MYPNFLYLLYNFAFMTDLFIACQKLFCGQVIINSEVWELRRFRLLLSVPSLDQTTITFNAHGDVIYAILRINIKDVMSDKFHTRWVKHPLFAAFRIVDAINYSDIATIPVDDCVIDFATEPTDSFVGLLTMSENDDYVEGGDVDDMCGNVIAYEIGYQTPTNNDSNLHDVGNKFIYLRSKSSCN